MFYVPLVSPSSCSSPQSFVPLCPIKKVSLLSSPLLSSPLLSSPLLSSPLLSSLKLHTYLTCGVGSRDDVAAASDSFSFLRRAVSFLSSSHCSSHPSRVRNSFFWTSRALRSSCALLHDISWNRKKKKKRKRRGGKEGKER